MNVSQESLDRGRAIRQQLDGSPSARTPMSIPAFDAVPGLEDFVTGIVFGEFWSRPALNLKTRSVATMAILCALGWEPQLRNHIGYALNLGWTPEEIKEVFVHSIPYSGAPAALNALRLAQEVFQERGA